MQNTEKLIDKTEKSAGRVVRNIRDEAENAMETAQEYGQMAVDESRTWIRRHPGQSLLAGFGAGLLAGLLIARR